jgi:hypothetical protein
MFLRFHEWRSQRKHGLSEWHAFRVPLFRKLILIEPKFIFFDWIMRRRLNNVWQYRAMTDQEYSDHLKMNDSTTTTLIRKILSIGKTPNAPSVCDFK